VVTARHPLLGNPGRAVLGTLAVGTVVAVEGGHDTYLATVGAILLTLLMYWIAHSYTELTGERLQGRARLTRHAIASAMRTEAPLLLGGVVPLAVILVF
jgi:hypothetical protein